MRYWKRGVIMENEKKYAVRRIGVLTSGGDAPGMNAAVPCVGIMPVSGMTERLPGYFQEQKDSGEGLVDILLPVLFMTGAMRK